MATAIAARHVYKHRGTGITGHYRPACAESRPRRRQRPANLEPCSTRVFDGLPAQTIWIKFHPETSDVNQCMTNFGPPMFIAKVSLVGGALGWVLFTTPQGRGGRVCTSMR